MDDATLGFIMSTPLLVGALTFGVAGMITSKFQKDR